MSRKATILLGVLLLAAVAGGMWLRGRPATRAPRPVPEETRVETPRRSPDAQDAMPILGWALHACYGVNHVGEQTTTVAAGGKQLTSRVELAYRRPGMTRLRYLSGPLQGVEVWEDRHRIYRHVPGKEHLEVAPAEPSEPLELGQRLELLAKNYTAWIEGADQVAGRKAHRIVLQPRHPGNPWKRIWIDQESYLMLGTEDYDAENRLLRSTRFETLALTTEPESLFRPNISLLKRAKWNPAAEAEALKPERVGRRVGFKVLMPSHVPAGYKLVGSYIVPCRCGDGENTVRTQYTDGLNTISLFQCGHPCAKGDDCWVAGAPQGVAVRRTRGEDSFMVVGEMDRLELEKMVGSIPPRTADGS